MDEIKLPSCYVENKFHAFIIIITHTVVIIHHIFGSTRDIYKYRFKKDK